MHQTESLNGVYPLFFLLFCSGFTGDLFIVRILLLFNVNTFKADKQNGEP